MDLDHVLLSAVNHSNQFHNNLLDLLKHLWDADFFAIKYVLEFTDMLVVNNQTTAIVKKYINK